MNLTTPPAETNKKGLYRLGGISAIVLGISYIVITVVYILGGALPSGAEGWLQFMATRTTAWWIILGLSVLTDMLFLPVALALYVALLDVNRNAALVGAGLVAMFAILDLAVTWPNYAALIVLSGDYAAATTDVQQTMIVAAAAYPVSVLHSILFSTYAILVPSLGILILGLVMLKGVFNKVTAYSGVATGILGIIAVVGPFVLSGLGTFAVLASVLTTIWVLLAGVRLVRLE